MFLIIGELYSCEFLVTTQGFSLGWGLYRKLFINASKLVYIRLRHVLMSQTQISERCLNQVTRGYGLDTDQ